MSDWARFQKYCRPLGSRACRAHLEHHPSEVLREWKPYGADVIPRGLAAHGCEVQGNVSRRCQRGGRDSFEFRPGISGRQTAQGYEIDRECPRGIDGGILGFC